MRRMPLITRFWPKVDQSGGPDACWPWRRQIGRNGYGRFKYEGRPTEAHRVAFFLTHGYWPVPNCLHTCDNLPCCNPVHLKEGTQAENMADKVAKGRQARGEKHSIAIKQGLRLRASTRQRQEED